MVFHGFPHSDYCHSYICCRSLDVYEVESILEQKLSATVTQDYTDAGGIESVVDVLNSVDRSTERTILDALEIQDPELAAFYYQALRRPLYFKLFYSLL